MAPGTRSSWEVMGEKEDVTVHRAVCGGSELARRWLRGIGHPGRLQREVGRRACGLSMAAVGCNGPLKVCFMRIRLTSQTGKGSACSRHQGGGGCGRVRAPRWGNTRRPWAGLSWSCLLQPPGIWHGLAQLYWPLETPLAAQAQTSLQSWLRTPLGTCSLPLPLLTPSLEGGSPAEPAGLPPCSPQHRLSSIKSKQNSTGQCGSVVRVSPMD